MKLALFMLNISVVVMTENDHCTVTHDLVVALSVDDKVIKMERKAYEQKDRYGRVARAVRES
jgi:hypothetical protein